MLAIILSFGAVDALIPLLIIIILIAAAAGLTRGWDALGKLFGISVLAGVGASAVAKGSMVKKSGFGKGRELAKNAEGFTGLAKKAGSALAARSGTVAAVAGAVQVPSASISQYISTKRANTLATSLQNSASTILGTPPPQPKGLGRVRMAVGGQKARGLAGAILTVAGGPAGVGFLAGQRLMKGGKYEKVKKQLENPTSSYEYKIRKGLGLNTSNLTLKRAEHAERLRKSLKIGHPTSAAELEASAALIQNRIQKTKDRLVRMQAEGFSPRRRYLRAQKKVLKSQLYDLVKQRELINYVNTIANAAALPGGPSAAAVRTNIANLVRDYRSRTPVVFNKTRINTLVNREVRGVTALPLAPGRNLRNILELHMNKKGLLATALTGGSYYPLHLISRKVQKIRIRITR